MIPLTSIRELGEVLKGKRLIWKIVSFFGLWLCKIDTNKMFQGPTVPFLRFFHLQKRKQIIKLQAFIILFSFKNHVNIAGYLLPSSIILTSSWSTEEGNKSLPKYIYTRNRRKKLSVFIIDEIVAISGNSCFPYHLNGGIHFVTVPHQLQQTHSNMRVVDEEAMRISEVYTKTLPSHHKPE